MCLSRSCRADYLIPAFRTSIRMQTQSVLPCLTPSLVRWPFAIVVHPSFSRSPLSATIYSCFRHVASCSSPPESAGESTTLLELTSQPPPTPSWRPPTMRLGPLRRVVIPSIFSGNSSAHWSNEEDRPMECTEPSRDLRHNGVRLLLGPHMPF